MNGQMHYLKPICVIYYPSTDKYKGNTRIPARIRAGVVPTLASTRAVNHILHVPAHISTGNTLPGSIRISRPLQAGCTEKYGPAG